MKTMKKKLRFIMLAVIGVLCFSGITVFAEEETSYDPQEYELLDYSELYGVNSIASVVEPLVEAAPVNGKIEFNYLAILVEFPDLKDITICDEDTLQAAELVLNGGDGKNYWGTDYYTGEDILEPVISLKDWLETHSYGSVSTEASFFPQEDGKVISYTTKHNITYYLKQSESNPDGYASTDEQYSRENALLQEILEAVKPQIEEHFSGDDLDKNNDGAIDAITFFVENDPENTDMPIKWNDLLWPHKNSLYIEGFDISGKYVSSYNLLSVGNPTLDGEIFSHKRTEQGITLMDSHYSIIIHEFLHTLGLPDLYRGPSVTGEPVSVYDLMADSHNVAPQSILTIQSRDTLHWGGEIPTLKKSGTITITKPEYKDSDEVTSYKIFSPYKVDEYFVVEYYDRPDYVDIAGGGGREGFLVYRVDTNVDTNIAQPMGRDYLFVFRPADTYANEGAGWTGYAPFTKDVGSRGGKTLEETGDAWDSDTFYYNDGTNSGITVEVINSTDSEITLQVTLPEVEGSGTEEDPYIIHNLDEWEKLVRDEAAVKLANDLDFTGVEYMPKTVYNLNLDGNGKTISGLDINGRGFFERISSSTVKDLNISNIQVNLEWSEMWDNIGGLVSVAENSYFENVTIESGNVTGADEANSVGGLVGNALGAKFKNCYSKANVSGGSYSGGFIGNAFNSDFTDCFASGSVQNTNGASGGFYGIKETDYGAVTFTDCAFDRKGTGQQTAGPEEECEGITGYEVAGNIEIDTSKDPYAAVTVTGTPDGVAHSVHAYTSDPSVASYDETQGRVMGVSDGQTVLYSAVRVGTHDMDLTSEVTVTHSDTDTKPDSDSDQGQAESGKKSNTKSGKSSVRTGDDQTHPMVYGAIMIAACFAVVITLKKILHKK